MKLKSLEKIARASGVLGGGLQYSRTFADCTTMQQKKAKLLKMLTDAGMRGTAAVDSSVVCNFVIDPGC